MLFALTLRTLIKILRRVIRSHHPDLKHQIITTNFNPRDPPPLKKSPNPNSVKFRNPILDDLAGDFLGIGGEVVVRREDEAAGAAEVDGEVAGGTVEVVGEDAGGEKSDGEAVVGEDGVSSG